MKYYYCINHSCKKEVKKIETPDKFKKFKKQTRDWYCDDCNLKLKQYLDSTPIGQSAKKIAKWQAGQTKSYSK